MPVEVIVGKVGRAHGIRGDVFVDVVTDEPKRRFAVGAQLRSDDGTTLEVASVKHHGGRLLLSFTGLTSRTAVERLTGTRLLAEVPNDEVPSGAEEYFDRQLVGLEVRRADGSPVGIVAAVQHMPAQDLLVVDVGADEVRLVPFVAALVPTVDLAKQYLQLADVQGLVEDLDED